MPRTPGGHVFQPTGIIFELIQDIIRMNLLTKFHEDQTINVASRVKNAPPLGSHVYQANVTILDLIQDIIETNLLNKFHEDLEINVASRVLKRKNAPPPGGHVFQPTGIIFDLIQDIIGMNLLTKFHKDQTNVASRETTHEGRRTKGDHKSSPWACGYNFNQSLPNVKPDLDIAQTNNLVNSHVIQLTGTIFELNSRIKETNVLSKFHENWAQNVTSTVLKCFHFIHIEKNAPPTGGHVFSPIPTIFKLIRDINKTNVLTNFHDDWAKIVTSRPKIWKTANIHIEKNAPPTGGHVFSPILTIFELFTRKTAPPTGGHVFQRIGTTFDLNQDIIKTNILINFELGRDFIGTKLLTKFYEDGTRNVASRVFTSKF
ncbi:hypothetical protein DPMN_101239 [Dreissena polymorpha]|uniref:Uncharacterized protein n=1 Tax=Dreissena polymorpha TaxID=45954 RepID=A0A9D4LKQ7_DREPO|nr:hypothetical protein DPMN_101239 [Dreissena polymorpha]